MTRFLIKDSNSGIRCWRMLVSSITCVGVFLFLRLFRPLRLIHLCHVGHIAMSRVVQILWRVSKLARTTITQRLR